MRKARAWGQASKLLQVRYDDGTWLDIDIRLISDNYDPAQNQSMQRMDLGPAGRLYPLRMDRLSTPRLWDAKHAALDEMRRSNMQFEAVVAISTTATMQTLPLGLAVPVQQPAAGSGSGAAGAAARAAPKLLINARQRAIDILRPGGKLIGRPGSTKKIRIVKGGKREALALFTKLFKETGGTPIENSRIPGRMYKLPGDGGTITYRAISKSDPHTIDVDIPGLRIREIKFIP